MTAVQEDDDDHDAFVSHPVEIATLVSSQDNSTKDNHTVLLEGSNELMQQLTLGHSASDPEINAHIEAVVDLETIRELAHEEDIVSLIVETQQHQQQQLNHQNQNNVRSSFRNEDASATTLTSAPVSNNHHTESQPLLLPTNKLDNYDGTVAPTAAGASLLLSADPFVTTLAHLHPREVKSDSADSANQQQPSLFFSEQHEHDAEGGTTQEHPVPKEAFLLSVPPEDIEHGTHPHPHHRQKEFVLALPDMDHHHVVEHTDQKITPDEDAEEEEDTTFGIVPLLQRALSELPSDVQAVEIHATTTTSLKEVPAAPTTIHLDLVIERKVPIIGFILLIAGLFSLASVGAALGLQGGGVGPLMKSYWRLQATSLCMFPLAARNLTWKELSKLSLAEWGFFVLCSFSYLYSTTAFVEALQMTTLANTFVLTNLTSINIIFSKFMRGIPVLVLEGLGAVVGISGAIICTLASTTNTGGNVHSNNAIHRLLLQDQSDDQEITALWGDLLAYSGSIASAVYLILAKTIRAKMDLFVFMWALFTLSSVLALFYMVCLGAEPDVTFDRHPVTGIFGWMHLVPDRFPLTLWLAIVCNIVGTTGFVAVLKYFEPVVVSMVMLAVPVVAAFEGAAVGVAPLPGLQTWVGDAIVMLGSTMVILSGTKKTEHIDATKAVVLDPSHNNNKKHNAEPHLGSKPPGQEQPPVLLKSPSARRRGAGPSMETIPERSSTFSRR